MLKTHKRQTPSAEPAAPEKKPRMIQKDSSLPPSPNITSELRPDGAISTSLTPPHASDYGSHSPEPSSEAEAPHLYPDNDLFVLENESLAPSLTPVALLHSSFDAANEASQPDSNSNEDCTSGNVQEPLLCQTLAPTAVPAEIYDFLDDGPDTTVAQEVTDHEAEEHDHERDALFAYLASDYDTYAQSPQHSSFEEEPGEDAPQSSESPAQASASVPEVMEEEENMAVRVELQPLNFEAVVGKPWREQQENTERFLRDMMIELSQLTSDTQAWASLKVVQVDQSARDILYQHIDKIDQMEEADRKAIGQLAQFAQSVETALLQMQVLSSM